MRSLKWILGVSTLVVIAFIVITFLLLKTADESKLTRQYTNDRWGVQFEYPFSFRERASVAETTEFEGAQGNIFLDIIPRKLDSKNIHDANGYVENKLTVAVGNRVGYLFTDTIDACRRTIVHTALGERILRIGFKSCKGGAAPIHSDALLIDTVLKSFRFIEKGSGWKKYDDLTNGYRIQIPEDYTAETKERTTSIYAPWEITARADPNYTDQPLGYHLTGYTADPKQSLEQWLRSQKKDCLAGSYCTLERWSSPEHKNVYFFHEDGLAEGPFTVYFREASDAVLAFTTYWGFEVNEQDSTFNTILSSFELINMD